ncbi:MAG: hypothetical protein DDT37_00763 [Firmicutes bacterium]|nr:hypothetical protein [candidate division NPL-UPA2 bacterium]
MTSSIGYAERSSRQELTDLWLSCFAERKAAVDLFFTHRFHPQNTLVLRIDGLITAMLHMLPGEILTETGPVPAHYIYAAATAPAFRGQGLMGQLMVRAEQEGAERGDHYAFLLPADTGLYGFYGKHGFTRFFKTTFCEVSRHELESMVTACGTHALNVAALPQLLKATRDTYVASSPGSAIWSEQAIDYAVRYTAFYGGRLVTAETNGRIAYALCSATYAGQCEVLEFAASPRDEGNLCAAILHAVPAENYRFRLSKDRALLDRSVRSTDFGMIKPLTPAAARSSLLQQASAPYLGLTLD